MAVSGASGEGEGRREGRFERDWERKREGKDMEDGAIVGEYRVPSEPGIKDTEMGRGSADVCV